MVVQSPETLDDFEVDPDVVPDSDELADHEVFRAYTAAIHAVKSDVAKSGTRPCVVCSALGLDELQHPFKFLKTINSSSNRSSGSAALSIVNRRWLVPSATVAANRYPHLMATRALQASFRPTGALNSLTVSSS